MTNDDRIPSPNDANNDLARGPSRRPFFAPQVSIGSAGGMSRRGVLTGLGVGALAASSVGQLLSSPPAAAANKRAVRDQAVTPPPFPAPGDFSVRASCDLTEDYFLTSEVLLNTANGDRVIPFVNAKNNNAVEAIVFTQGVNNFPASVSHLQRNPAVPSGWSFVQFDLTEVIAWPIDVAVAADGTNVNLMVLSDPNQGSPDAVAWLSQLDSATSWDTGTVVGYDDLGYSDLKINPDNSTFGVLKTGIDKAGNIYFYDSATQDQTTYLLGWVAGTGWASGDFSYQLLQQLDVSAASVTDYMVLFDTSQGAKPVGYSLVLTANGDFSGYAQAAYTTAETAQFDDPMNDIGTTGVSELIWAWASPTSTTGAPGYAIQTKTETLFVDESGNDETLSDQASVGANAATIWLDNNLYTVNLLDSGDTLSTTAQYDDGSGPTWGSAVPIGVGLSDVFSVPTDPNEATLFAVDPGGVLNVLTKSSATGWSQNVIHQDAASSLEVVSWRCQISLFDANGAGVGVGNGSVQLSTSLPIDIWQHDSSIVLLPGDPVTLHPDATGQISVNIPTAELDTAQLTAVPLDSSGKPNGPTLTIVPNSDTQNYLAGTGSLTSVGGTALSGTSLVNANNSTWDSTSQAYVSQGAIMPALASAGAAAAGEVATAIGHVMSLPKNNPSTAGGAQSALLDFTGATPSFQTSTDPTAFDSHKTGDTSWWSKAEHDIKSVFRGLRHDAIKVGKMVTTWAKDVEQWTINLVVDIGDGIDRLMNWVVNSIEDAYHAVSSFLKSLGTDIKHIWNWVKDLVLGALRDAGKNAKQIETWTETLVDEMLATINSAESFASGFFKGLEADVNTKLTTLQDQVEDELFGTHTEQPTPPAGTGGDDSGSHFEGAQDVFHFLAHSPASWLMKKLMADIEPLEGSALASIQFSTFSPFITDLANDVDGVADTIVDAATTLGQLLEDAASSPTSFDAAKMTDLFIGFEKVADDILSLLDSLVNTALDLLKAFIESLNDLITAEFQPPFLGEILRLAGVDSTPSILHLSALVIAYPATMVHALFAAAAGGAGQAMFPFDTDAAVGSSNSDWAGFGLDVASAVTQFVWATIDVGLESVTYDGSDPSPFDNKLIDFFTVIDFLCPLILTIFQWPVPPTYTGTQTPAPFHYDDFSDGTTWGNEYKLLPGIFVTGGVPWLMEAIGFFVAHVDADEGKTFNDKALPVAQTLSSAANIILEAWYSFANATTAGEKTLAIIPPVISNLSYLDAIFASDYAKAVADQMQWLKFYIDIFGNYATVAIDISEAIAAAAK